MKKEIIFLLVAIFISFNLVNYTFADDFIRTPVVNIPNESDCKPLNTDGPAVFFWNSLTDEEKASPQYQFLKEIMEDYKQYEENKE